MNKNNYYINLLKVILIQIFILLIPFSIIIYINSYYRYPSLISVGPYDTNDLNNSFFNESMIPILFSDNNLIFILILILLILIGLLFIKILKIKF